MKAFLCIIESDVPKSETGVVMKVLLGASPRSPIWTNPPDFFMAGTATSVVAPAL